MAWPDPMVDAIEAIAWFRARVPVTPTAWAKLGADAKRRAFRVAGATRLSLVTDVWRAIDRAIAQGLPYEAFEAEVGAKLVAAWGDTVTKPSHRLQLIYNANVQSAYAAGRYNEMTDPDVIRAYPYWMYDSVLDERTSDLCRGLNGTILPADHEFWQTRYPPNHFGCRAGIRTLTRRGAERRGGETASPPVLPAAPGFQSVPGADDWTPNPADYPPDVWAEYERTRGAGP